MFRRSRFSVRPNVGATGRTAAPKDTTSVNPESGESACLVAESPSDVTDNTSVVAPPESNVASGDGNDPPGEASSTSAAVQRRKRFSVKPKVAPGRPSATIRPTKAPAEKVSAASTQESSIKLVPEESGSSTLSQTGQSPRQQKVSDVYMQSSAEPETSLINHAKTSKVETETIEPPKKEIHSRPTDIAPLSIPNRETHELSEKAKTLMSKPLKLPSIPQCSLSRLLNDPSDIQKIEKTRKLRELLRQEMHKEKNKHRRPKYRVKEFSLDPAKMTMRDLLHYFPTSNPMSSSLEETTLENETVLPNSPQRAVSPETTKEPDAKSVNRDEDEEGAAGEEEDDDAVMVPQVKVAEDGSLIIDEESLTVEVQRTKGPNPTEDKDPIFERGSTTTYSSFRKGTHTKPWSSEETDMFFLAISMVGTDFSMICQLFTHRARAEIKNKFKKEERMNAWRIDKAFRERRKLDLEYFTKLLEKVLEVQKNKKKKKTGRDRGKSAAKKRDKKAKGKALDILSDMEEEDEDEEEEDEEVEGNDILELLNDDDEQEGEKENEDLCNDGGTQISTRKGKRKKTSKNDADEDMAGKRNREEKTSEQDQLLSSEDSATLLPEEQTTSVQADDNEGKKAPKSSVIKPAKLSRGRAPQPLLPLGKKWSKKLPTVCALTPNETATAAREQEKKQGSPERQADGTRNDKADSSDDECSVHPSKPTRSGRMPKPVQHLSYTPKEDSSSEKTRSSATGIVPKIRQKRGRESKAQSAPAPKKSKLVTLTASQSDYSDDEDETLRDEEEEDEGLLKQGMELSPGKESSAPAFVPVCLRSARVTEEVETIEELDILASIPNVLDMTQENETGTTEPEHQLDLLLDVIDLLSSGPPGVSDESYNEAAQTLLTIGNLTSVSQLNETITQDQPSVEAQVAGRSNDIEESLLVGCAGEGQSAFPLLTADHKSAENSMEPPITDASTSAIVQAQSDSVLDRESTSPEIPVQDSSQPKGGGCLPKIKPKPNLNRTLGAVPSKSRPSRVEESQVPQKKVSKCSAEASSHVKDATSADGRSPDQSGHHSGQQLEEPIPSTSGTSERSKAEQNKPLKNVVTEKNCIGASSDLASTKSEDSYGNASTTSQAEFTPSIRRAEENQLTPTKEVASSDAGEFRAGTIQDVSPENLGKIAHESASSASTDPQNTDQMLNESNTSESIVSGAPQSQSTPIKRERLPKVKPKPNLGRAPRTTHPKSQSALTVEENQANQQIPSTSIAGETGQLFSQNFNSAERQGLNPSHTRVHVSATSEPITDMPLDLPGGETNSSTEPSKFQSSPDKHQSQETLSSKEASQNESGIHLGQTLEAKSGVLDPASLMDDEKSSKGKSNSEITEKGSPLAKGGRLSRVKPKPNLARASRVTSARVLSASTADEKQPLSTSHPGEMHALAQRHIFAESLCPNPSQTETLFTSDSSCRSGVSDCTSTYVTMKLPVADKASRTGPASSQSSIEDVPNQEILLSHTSGTHLTLNLEHTTSDGKCRKGNSNHEIAEKCSPLTRHGHLSRVKPKPNLVRASKTATAKAQSSASTAEEQQSQETRSTAEEICLALTQSHVCSENQGSYPLQTVVLPTSDTPSTSSVSSCTFSNVLVELPVGDTASRSEPPKPQLPTNKVQSEETPLSKEASNTSETHLERTSSDVSDHGSKTVDEKSGEGKFNAEIAEKGSSLSRGGRLSRVKPKPNLERAPRTVPAKSKSLKRSNEGPPSISHAAEPCLESPKEDTYADKPIQIPSEVEALPTLELATSGGSDQVAMEFSEGVQSQQKDPQGSANVDLTPELIENPEIPDKSLQPVRKRFSRLKPKPNLKQASKAGPMVSPKIQVLDCNPDCSIPAMVSGESPCSLEQASVSAAGKSMASIESVTIGGRNGGASSSSGQSSRVDSSQESTAVAKESAEPARPIRVISRTELRSKESSESLGQSLPTSLELDKSTPSVMLPSSSTQVLPEEQNLSETIEETDWSSTSLDLFDWPHKASEYKAQVIAGQVSVPESPSPLSSVRASDPARTPSGEESSDVKPTTAVEKTDLSVCAIESTHQTDVCDDESHCSSHLTPLLTPKQDLSHQHPAGHPQRKPCEDTIHTSTPESSLKAATAGPQSNSRRQHVPKAKPNLGASAQAREPKAQGKVTYAATESPSTVTVVQPEDNNGVQTYPKWLAVLGPTTSTSQEGSHSSCRRPHPAQIQAALGNVGPEQADVDEGGTREVRHDEISSASTLKSVECPGETARLLTKKPSKPSCNFIQKSCESKEELQMSSGPTQKSTDDALSEHGSPKIATQTQHAGLVKLKPNLACSSRPDLEAAQTEKGSINPEPEVQHDTQVPVNTAAAEMAGIAAFQSLFPDMLSVPSDPDEPFFVLSLTAVPVCPSGEVEAPGGVSYLPTTDASEQLRSGESLPVEGDVSLQIVPVETEPTPVSVRPLHRDGLIPTSEKPGRPLVAKELENAADQQEEVDAPPAKTRKRAEQPEVKPETKQRSRARRRKVNQSSRRAGPPSQPLSVDTDEGCKLEVDTSREGGAAGKSRPATSTPLRKPKASRSLVSCSPECQIPDNRAAPCAKRTVAPVVEEQRVTSHPAMTSAQSEATRRLQEPTVEATRTEPSPPAEVSFDGAVDEATSVCHYFLSDIFTAVEDT